ncbi:MAG: hypothetical protein WAV98_00205 [Minisyncoccia bacterium]
MNPEKSFNPSNPEYKEVKDLPRAFRDDFVNTEDGTGFVRESADKHLLEAERQADKNLREGNLKGESAADVLHESGNEMNLDRSKVLERIVQGKLDLDDVGRYLSREEQNKVAYNNTERFIEQWKHDREVLKFILANRYNIGFRHAQLFPKELLNDEDFIFDVINVGGSIDNDLLSERIKSDPEIMLRLLKTGQRTRGSGGYSDEIPSLLTKDRDFMLKAIKIDPSFVNQAHESIKDTLWESYWESIENTESPEKFYGAVRDMPNRYLENKSMYSKIEKKLEGTHFLKEIEGLKGQSDRP